MVRRRMGGRRMKKLLIKFANWILRKCIKSKIGFGDKVFVNGVEHTFSKVTTEISPQGYSIVNIELIEGNPIWWR